MLDGSWAAVQARRRRAACRRAGHGGTDSMRSPQGHSTTPAATNAAQRHDETPAVAAQGSAWLACPECGRPLRQDHQELQCPECLNSWPVIDGVPHFVGEFPYWGEIPQEQMQGVNRAAAAGPWKSALLDSPETSVRGASDMIQIGRAS